MNNKLDAYDFAAENIGLWEWKGGDHNPKIVQWFADVGHSWVVDDETAWCAAFVGAMLKKAGLPHTGKLNARSYMEYGDHVELDEAQKGDICIFWRSSPDSWKGHVAFFHEYKGSQVEVLGGNQKDQVNISAYRRDRLLAVRRPKQQRTSIVQSGTMQSVAVASASTAITSGLAAFGNWSENAQMAIVACAFLTLISLGYIGRSRLKKWGKGDR